MNPSEGRHPVSRIDVRINRDVSLPGRAWCAPRPRGLVAIVHGLGEHGGRYAALAGALVDRRFTVVALDLPGHGEAPGRRGDVPSWIFVRDSVIPAMLTMPRGMPGQPADLPAVLLGHSLGGVWALDYALTHSRSLLGLVISGPAFKTPPPSSLKLALAKVARVLAPSRGFPNGLDISGISRDPEVLEKRRSDPLMHDLISPRTYFCLEEARRRVASGVRRLAVPTLVLQGAADRVVNPLGALELAGAAPHGVVRLLTYKDGYHEVFNDTGRERAIQDLIGWLDAILVV
ncbi:MAG TPA: alpha/beta hydrolase [Candidatus Eisenbacteria bacterium]